MKDGYIYAWECRSTNKLGIAWLAAVVALPKHIWDGLSKLPRRPGAQSRTPVKTESALHISFSAFSSLPTNCRSVIPHTRHTACNSRISSRRSPFSYRDTNAWGLPSRSATAAWGKPAFRRISRSIFPSASRCAGWGMRFGIPVRYGVYLIMQKVYNFLRALLRCSALGTKTRDRRAVAGIPRLWLRQSAVCRLALRGNDPIVQMRDRSAGEESVSWCFNSEGIPMNKLTHGSALKVKLAGLALSLIAVSATAAPTANWTTVLTGAVNGTGTVVTNACAAASVGHYLIASSSGSLVSTDGQTWPSTVDYASQNYPPAQPVGVPMAACAVWANNAYAAIIGDDPTVSLLSSDGIHWNPTKVSQLIAGSNFAAETIIWNGTDYFIAGTVFASDGSSAYITLIQSADGTTWTPVATTGLLTSAQAGTTSLAARGLWYTAGEYYLIAENGHNATYPVYVSSDGVSWSAAVGLPASLVNAAPLENGFAVLAASNTVYATTNGTSWTPWDTSAIPAGDSINAVASAQGLSVLVGGDGSGNGVIYTSTDNSTWTAASIGSTTPETLYTVATDGCHFITGGAGGDIVFGGIVPAASDSSLAVSENTPATGTLGSVPACYNTAYSLAANPDHGTVTVTNAATGAYTYTPAANFAGNDSFTYTVLDNQDDLKSTPATVNVTVTSSVAPSPSSPKSGGGAFGLFSLLVLAAAFISWKSANKDQGKHGPTQPT